MCYGITDMTTEEIKEMLTDIYGEVDEETDVYFLFLMEELERRLPEADFTDFCEYIRYY